MGHYIFTAVAFLFIGVPLLLKFRCIAAIACSDIDFPLG